MFCPHVCSSQSWFGHTQRQVQKAITHDAVSTWAPAWHWGSQQPALSGAGAFSLGTMRERAPLWRYQRSSHPDPEVAVTLHTCTLSVAAVPWEQLYNILPSKTVSVCVLDVRGVRYPLVQPRDTEVLGSELLPLASCSRTLTVRCISLTELSKCETSCLI